MVRHNPNPNFGFKNKNLLPIQACAEGTRRTVTDVDLVRRRPNDDVTSVVHNHALPRPRKQHKELSHPWHRVLWANFHSHHYDCFTFWRTIEILKMFSVEIGGYM